MNPIAKLKIYEIEDLLHLLFDCAQNLASAYQEIQEMSLFVTSEEARRACEYLLYTIHKQNPNLMMIH